MDQSRLSISLRSAAYGLYLTLDALSPSAETEWHQFILEFLSEGVVGSRVHAQWLEHVLLEILLCTHANDLREHQGEPPHHQYKFIWKDWETHSAELPYS